MDSPRRQDLGGFYVSHDVQEVITHEHSPLQQEEGKADAVPDNSRFPTGQLAGGVVISCGNKAETEQAKMNSHFQCSVLGLVHSEAWVSHTNMQQHIRMH